MLLNTFPSHLRSLALPALLAVVALLTACSQELADLPADQRPLATELPAGGRDALRRLPLAGTYNFRDLGGYQTVDGRSVKWGQLFRSDALHELDEEDNRYLQRLGLRRVTDFRTEAERLESPDNIPADSGIVQEHMPIGVTGVNFEVIKEQINAGELDGNMLQDLLIDANREFVEKYTILYRSWIHSLLEKDSLPLVFHCTAGKDRTGFAAAITLLALGVPKDVVMQDYLATNTYSQEFIDKVVWMVRIGSLFRSNGDELRPVLGVEQRFLEEAFAAIEEHYGSVDNYLREGLDLDEKELEQLRELLLEPAAPTSAAVDVARFN